MSIVKSDFEKKDLAFSSTPYVYLPVELPLYTVEVCHREELNGELLQQALDKTIARMPYLSDTLVEENGRIYYAKNPLRMEAAHTATLRRVGGAETNYHMLDLCWDGNKTWFSMFHGFCDGQGINAFLESVLYHYYCLKDGVDYEPNGIRSERDPYREAEEYDPCSRDYEIDPDFKMTRPGEQPTPWHMPELAPKADTTVLSYGLSIPSGAFMDFVRQNKTSPAVALSLLAGEAIQRMHPEADAPIVSNIPVSIRRILGCEETFKNCSSRAVLPLSGTPLDALPFAERASALRGALKKQLEPNAMRARQNYVGGLNRQRMENAVSYAEEMSKPSGFLGTSHDTFYVDYIGSLRQTDYAAQITGVHFLCKPAGGNTMHMNMIEHNGRFQIECLSCWEIPAFAEALAALIREHGLEVESTPVRRFMLPLTAWREVLAL